MKMQRRISVLQATGLTGIHFQELLSRSSKQKRSGVADTWHHRVLVHVSIRAFSRNQTRSLVLDVVQPGINSHLDSKTQSCSCQRDNLSLLVPFFASILPVDNGLSKFLSHTFPCLFSMFVEHRLYHIFAFCSLVTSTKNVVRVWNRGLHCWPQPHLDDHHFLALRQRFQKSVSSPHSSTNESTPLSQLFESSISTTLKVVW